MSSDNRNSADDALPQPDQPKLEAAEGVRDGSSFDKESAPVADDTINSKQSTEEDEVSRPTQLSVDSPPGPSPAEAALQKQVGDVLTSEIGISTLLGRLKQSVVSAKEFATFLKKRAILEDDHAQSLKKVCRSTQDNMRRADHRQGSYAHSYDEMMSIHDRMAENGIQFAASLHQMHEDLIELAANADRNRKTWKQNGLAAEQKVADMEQTMRKSKAKYDSLAEEYDRARTGEARQGGKVLGAFKAHKSAAQQEEDLLRKVQAADQTYAGHVQALQTEKSQLVSSTRPEAIKALQDLINEIDSGVTLQMQKFAAFNEKLLLGNGLIVYPFKNQPGDNAPQQRSLRQAISSINNERDLNEFISSHHSKVQLNVGEVKYEKHPVLNPQPSSISQPAPGPGPQIPQQAPSQPPSSFSQGPPGSFPQQQSFSMGSRTSTGNFGPPSSFPTGQPGAPPGSQLPPGSQGPQGSQGPPPGSQGPGPGPNPNFPQGGLPDQPRQYGQQQHARSFSQGNPLAAHAPTGGPQQPPQQARNSAQPTPGYGNGPGAQPQGPPQLGALPFQGSQPLTQRGPQDQAPPADRRAGPLGQNPGPPPSQGPPPPHYGGPSPGGLPQGGLPQGGPASNLPPQSKPVFGVPLNRLYERDGLAVPMVVYQCIQAVDLYGLGVEGIYRQSGSLTHINKLKSMFDADSQNPALDFRNPENFYHDVNSVTGLLKQFFRDLPDPLLTSEHHDSFVSAAMQEDDTVRRDSLHAIINSLPDPNYATLRAITLHLYRVMDNAHVTRMNSHNLAVIFGPTLMGSNPSTAIANAGWQIKVIDTILQNTYQIFDED